MVPGATSVTVTRFPRIFKSTTVSMTMGRTHSPAGVLSDIGSTRKELTTAEGVIGLDEEARSPTITFAEVESLWLFDF